MANGKAIKIAALLVVMALIAGVSPVRARAARSGGVFESEEFGVTLTWDDGIWTGNPTKLDNGEGVEFESLASFGAVNVTEGEYTSSDDCRQNMEDFFANDEGYVDFAAAPRRMERPESSAGGSGELYTYTFVDDESGDSLDMAFYLECNVLPGEAGAINIFLTTDEQNYADELASWNDLIGGVDLGSGSGTKSTTKGSSTGKTDTTKGAAKTGIKGDTYTNVDLGFSLSWDNAFWTATELDNADGQGVELDAGSSYAYILGVTNDKGITVDDCLGVLSDSLTNNDSFSRVRVASSSVKRPKLARNATGELYTFTSADSGNKMVAYLECRPLANGGLLTFQFASLFDDYEADAAQWQGVLDSVDQPSGSSTSTTKGDSTNKPTTNTNTGTTKGSTKGSTKGDSTNKPAAGSASLTTTNNGVQIAYDDAVWTPTDNSADGIDQIDFTSDYGNVTVIALTGNPDLAGCVQTLVDTKAKSSTDGLTPAPRSLDRPQAARGAEAELYTLAVDTNSGPVDALYYVECRELGNGQGLVAITYLTVPAVYEAALPALESLLAGVQA